MAALAIAALIGLTIESPQGAQVDRPAERATKVEAPVSADERIAGYTAALAWFTALLALVSAAQIAFLFRGDKTARISANAALTAAGVGERALTELERPIVIADLREAKGLIVSQDKDGQKWSVGERLSFELRNYGRTPAFLHEIRFAFKPVRGPRLIEPINAATERGNDLPNGVIVAPGRPYMQHYIGIAFDMLETLEDPAATWTFCLTGYVSYGDIFGNRRIYGFGAINVAGEWQIAGDERYNYDKPDKRRPVSEIMAPMRASLPKLPAK